MIPLRCVARVVNRSTSSILLNRELRFSGGDPLNSTIEVTVTNEAGVTPERRRKRSSHLRPVSANEIGALKPGDALSAWVEVLREYAPLELGTYRIDAAYVSRPPRENAARQDLAEAGAWFGRIEASSVEVRVAGEDAPIDLSLAEWCEREWERLRSLGLESPEWDSLPSERRFEEKGACIQRACQLMTLHANRLVRAKCTSCRQTISDLAAQCRRDLGGRLWRCVMSAADFDAALSCR